jgi:hypothetical protein
MGDSLNKMLADVLVSVGGETKITVDFVENMLACDRKKCLTELRQFTLGEDTFEFDWEYNSNGQKLKHHLSVPLGDGFPTETVKKLEDGGVVDANYESYEEVLANKEIEVELPSGMKVKYRMLDGKGEAAGMMTKKAQRSSHTPLVMRNPRYFVKPDEKSEGSWVQVNLDKMSIRDIEFLRKHIREMEGRVDTEWMFDHPEADQKSPDEKEVVVDLVTQLAFFFPSGAI